ncbi:MAG: hypothetical protein KAI70_08165, partial [Candidatus Omnitrophica bacterium]|nr:hypothetical protein [Candidatus Omnitrophota bacterium]
RALKAALNAEKIIQNSSLVIAVNTGDIYLGTIGHPDYSSKDIYGDAVNRTFLMNEAVSEGIKRGIALSESAKSEIKGEYNFKKHDELTIGRLNEKMDVYEVSGNWA